MTWSERMKKTIDTFKRMALPLYLFYLLFSLIGFIIAVVAVGLFLIPYLRMEGFGSTLPAVPYIGPDIPYLDPSIPVPPGYNPSMEFGPAPEYGLFNEFAPYLEMIPQFIGLFLLVMLISWLLVSFFLTGVFHLTKKAYVEKTKFSDIKFRGFPRISGWYLIVALIGFFLVGIGVVIALSFTSEYALALFSIIYILVLMAIGLFLAPWPFTAPYYMLNQPRLSFGESFKASWRFYRRYMGPLWASFLTVMGIQLLVNLINRNAPDLGLLISFIITPFLTILPIVWVLTLEEEEQPLAVDDPYSGGSHSPFNTSSTPYSGYAPDLSHVDPYPSAPASPSRATDYNPPSSSVAPEPNIPLNSDNPAPKHAPSAPPVDPYIPPRDPYSPPRDPYTPPKDPYTPSGHPYTTYEPKEDSPFMSPSTGSNTSSDSDDGPINFCPTCGKKVREKASYCSQCGTKL